jgi:hypothetical protein
MRWLYPLIVAVAVGLAHTLEHSGPMLEETMPGLARTIDHVPGAPEVFGVRQPISHAKFSELGSEWLRNTSEEEAMHSFCEVMATLDGRATANEAESGTSWRAGLNSYVTDVADEQVDQMATTIDLAHGSPGFADWYARRCIGLGLLNTG